MFELILQKSFRTITEYGIYNFFGWNHCGTGTGTFFKIVQYRMKVKNCGVGCRSGQKIPDPE